MDSEKQICNNKNSRDHGKEKWTINNYTKDRFHCQNVDTVYMLALEESPFEQALLLIIPIEGNNK